MEIQQVIARRVLTESAAVKGGKAEYGVRFSAARKVTQVEGQMYLEKKLDKGMEYYKKEGGGGRMKDYLEYEANQVAGGSREEYIGVANDRMFGMTEEDYGDKGKHYDQSVKALDNIADKNSEKFGLTKTEDQEGLKSIAESQNEIFLNRVENGAYTSGVDTGYNWNREGTERMDSKGWQSGKKIYFEEERLAEQRSSLEKGINGRQSDEWELNDAEKDVVARANKGEFKGRGAAGGGAAGGGGEEGAGDGGECCVFNQYGGGGCGPCSKGSSSSRIIFASLYGLT